MIIYVLSGFAPDPVEQTLCTLAEVFTDENKARETLNEIKKLVEGLLEDNYDNGRLEYYSVESREVRHNKFTLGGLLAEVTISPGNERHQDMWRDWSTATIGTGCCCISTNDVSLNLGKNTTFRIAAVSLSIKEV